jgi:hypothetical protein
MQHWSSLRHSIDYKRGGNWERFQKGGVSLGFGGGAHPGHGVEELQKADGVTWNCTASTCSKACQHVVFKGSKGTV